MQSHTRFATFQRSLSPRDHPDAYGLQFWYWREPAIGSDINRAFSGRPSIPEAGFRPLLKFLPRPPLVGWDRFPTEAGLDSDWCSRPPRPAAREPARNR